MKLNHKKNKIFISILNMKLTLCNILLLILILAIVYLCFKKEEYTFFGAAEELAEMKGVKPMNQQFVRDNLQEIKNMCQEDLGNQYATRYCKEECKDIKSELQNNKDMSDEDKEKLIASMKEKCKICKINVCDTICKEKGEDSFICQECKGFCEPSFI